MGLSFGAECRAINYYAFLPLRPFDLGAETMEDRSARYQQILGEVLPRMGDLWTQEWLPTILPGLDKARTRRLHHVEQRGAFAHLGRDAAGFP